MILGKFWCSHLPDALNITPWPLQLHKSIIQTPGRFSKVCFLCAFSISINEKVFLPTTSAETLKLSLLCCYFRTIYAVYQQILLALPSPHIPITRSVLIPSVSWNPRDLTVGLLHQCSYWPFYAPTLQAILKR